MVGRLKGLFSKWYCPQCNTIMSRRDVRYQEQTHAYGVFYYFKCLNCGNDDRVRPLKEEFERIVISNGEQGELCQRYRRMKR